ncbi:peptidylprolyl isomerase [Marinobacter zhejiangensis]|uniref:peptidylprolyl isomerase n=1 Tax=Marinobacter zhejiangensis TaxID=488535 RepID=UPI000B865467
MTRQLTLAALLISGSASWAGDDAEVLPKVAIQTSEGTMVLTLRPDVAPETVKNFLEYVDSGFYEGTIFHRVIPGFMIQGGGFDQGLARKSTNDPVRNEASPTLRNLRGTIAMARTNDPHSATSQFFINVVDNAFLNAGARGPGYAVFGRVTDGLGVADAIASKATRYSGGMADVPVEPIIIERIERLEPTAQ